MLSHNVRTFIIEKINFYITDAVNSSYFENTKVKQGCGCDEKELRVKNVWYNWYCTMHSCTQTVVGTLFQIHEFST